MLDSQFFGAEPLLINKVIFYTERRTQGKYVYEPAELAKVITGYRNTNDYASLEQILKELFSICSQGRRPWSIEAEQAFHAIALAGYDLLDYLRVVGKVRDETYAFIDPLDMALRLEYEAEHIQETGSQNGAERWGSTLGIFYRLIHLYILTFDFWTSDYPQTAKLPAIDSMKYLLETGDDSDFAVLLKAFAKTRSPQAKQILINFSRDSEEPTRALADQFLEMYF